MILELNANDKITLRFSLIENKVNTERRIRETTEELNSSKNIKEVRETYFTTSSNEREIRFYY